MQRLFPLSRLFWALALGAVFIGTMLALVVSLFRSGSIGWFTTATPVPTIIAAVPDPAQLPLILPSEPLGNLTPRTITIEQAQAQIRFTIRQPAKLPDGYRFLGVMPILDEPSIPPPGGIAPNSAIPGEQAPKTPPQLVILLFTNDANERLMLTQLNPDNPVLRAPPSLEPTNIQQVTVSGQPGYYIQGTWDGTAWRDDGSRRLYWIDKAGILYDFTGRGLSLEELLATAQIVE